MRVSDRISRVEYAIRDVMLHAKEYQKTGKEIMYLNIGDPVAFDFKTPEHIKMALAGALDKDNDYYTDSEGWAELRKSIVIKEKGKKGLELTPEDILVTNGVSEGLDMVMGSSPFAWSLLSSIFLICKILWWKHYRIRNLC
jgi:alanine-synthesizing transaminase